MKRFMNLNVSWRKVGARVLILAGLGMIAYYYGTGVYTFSVQRDLRSQWQESINSPKSVNQGGDETTTPAPDISGSGIFGRLRIPKLDLDVIVLEGTDIITLRRGPGHIKKTAWPSEEGNTAVSGHRTTYGAPFAELDRLEKGDLILLTTLEGDYEYQVTGSGVVRPTNLSVIGQNYKGRLTLTTCDPPGSAVKRLAVWSQKK